MAIQLGAQKGGRGVRPEMNVTPLVDVVLVLLIIFMVVTPLMQKKFWVNVPKEADEEAAPPPARASAPIVVTYGADGALRLNGEAMARAELARRLQRALAARGDGLVFFDADDDADLGAAIAIMDLARESGAGTVAISPRVIGGAAP